MWFCHWHFRTTKRGKFTAHKATSKGMQRQQAIRCIRRSNDVSDNRKVHYKKIIRVFKRSTY